MGGGREGVGGKGGGEGGEKGKREGAGGRWRGLGFAWIICSTSYASKKIFKGLSFLLDFSCLAFKKNIFIIGNYC